ncbi:uncharacterized protein LOC119315519 [Triticum dicoccoides]|uniref:uncharacterized protein LOC119315519 n=1 Tax=Triticum dicoccoides TaxID=85692 RepID=UPI001890DE2A|nr:uncharacterized protein LOC119315519 [Triticum dicoccoides]
MDSPPIPGELLADIFLRLPDPADLVRVSAGCTSFRHLIADRSFLRRYRRLHAPPFLGFLDYNRVFHAVVTPHPSASAAGAVALAADFSFSFLPGPASDWAVQDVCDGRVLLERHPKFEVIFREVVVCDPLHRRYLLLPPIPGDLAESVDSALWTKPQTFLAPSEDEEEASFSVISMVQCLTKLFAFAFFSNTGQWRTISSQSWSNLFAGLPSLSGMTFFSRREYAYGLFYWVASSREKLLVLDSQSMEFSIVEHPPEARGIPGGDIAIVEAGDGRPGMFVRAEDTNYLNYAIRRNDFGSSSKWQLDKKIPLDSGYFFLGSMGRHLFLYHCRNPPVDARCFSLDVKTLKLERVFLSSFCITSVHAYSNFPPSLLSTPTVSSGFGNRAENETLEQGFAARSGAQSARSE